MSANPGHHYDQLQRILQLLQAGEGIEAIVASTGIGGTNSGGRRLLRRWLQRHGRPDLWDWICENSEGAWTGRGH